MSYRSGALTFLPLNDVPVKVAASHLRGCNCISEAVWCLYMKRWNACPCPLREHSFRLACMWACIHTTILGEELLELIRRQAHITDL